jgi:NitT/TauT family transport system permease protein
MTAVFRRIVQSPTAAGLAGLAVFVLALQYMVGAGWIDHTVVARPSDVIAAFPFVDQELNLVGSFLSTLGTTVAATALSLAVGVPLGYLFYRKRTFGLAYEGWLAAGFAAPIVLLYPLFLVIFGRTILMLVLMSAIPGTIPITIHVYHGLRGVPKTLINVGRSLNVPERQMFWKIALPAATPTIFAGVRVGVMYILINVIAIEYLINFGGLGRVVSEMAFRFEVPGTYAGILLVIVVSVLFYVVMGRVERWLRPQ